MPDDPVCPEPELIDAQWLSRLTLTSVKTIRRMADSGDLPPAIRLGRLVRWRRSEIQRWIADGCPACSSLNTPKGASAQSKKHQNAR